ncbi:oxygenase MpaB family protein [Streptomyces sp. NPDC046985]|uniref:oxygenase MpaB family protein n=1 Tax=Streptomyces sp. NPDC046985 TaxID=3155377 RepID=UPI0033E3E835
MAGITTQAMASLRRRTGGALFARVAGPDGPRNRMLIHSTPGPRWFAPDSAIRRVHADSSMFIGGLSALLLQSLHPVAMAAVAAHSGFRGDPWGRLQRTSTFLATTTYGTAENAQSACDRLNAVHARITGVTDEGVGYCAADPHLLLWVHVAEAASFLSAHQEFGAHPLTPRECDDYVADMARVARALGVPDAPRTLRELHACLAGYRTELRCTPAALETTRYLLLQPPVPLAALPFYSVLASNAVSLLPRWASHELRIVRSAWAERLLVRPLGAGAARLIRWVMAQPRPLTASGTLPEKEERT